MCIFTYSYGFRNRVWGLGLRLQGFGLYTGLKGLRGSKGLRVSGLGF